MEVNSSPGAYSDSTRGRNGQTIDDDDVRTKPRGDSAVSATPSAQQAAVAEQEQQKAERKAEMDASIHTIELSAIRSFHQAGTKSAKIFWLTLLILGTAIFVWQLYKTIDNYVNSPIVSSYTITTKQEMKMPKIYVCPMSITRNDYLHSSPNAEQELYRIKEQLDTTWQYMEYFARGDLSQSYSTENVSETGGGIVPTAFRDATKFKPNFTDDHSEMGPRPKSVDPEAYFKNVSVALPDHMRYCEFRHFNFLQYPCKNITKEVFDPEYGKCYLIDLGDQTQTVQSQALYFVFHVQAGQYPINSSLTPLFNGVRVSIEDEFSVRPSGEHTFLPPGTYNRIDLTVQKQGFISFSRPYEQKCQDNENFQYQIFDVNYTQRSCGYECAARALKDQCGCLPPVDRMVFKPEVLQQTSRFCMSEDVGCIRRIMDNDEAKKTLTECRQQCHIACSQWRYDARASTFDLYAPALPGRPSQMLTYVFISFSAMEYTEFSQDYSCTADDFISKVGGEINLWLGASLMTIVQIPVALIAIFGYCCVKRTKKVVVKRNAGRPVQ